MSFLVDLPKELQIIISNYYPQFIILCDHSNWHLLIRENFKLEFSASVPSAELRSLYIEKYLEEKFIFCGAYHTFVRSRKGEIMSCGYNTHGQLGHGNDVDISSFKKINDLPESVAQSRLWCSSYNNSINEWKNYEHWMCWIQ